MKIILPGPPKEMKNSVNIRFCPKCNEETARYDDGKCKPCKRANGIAWRKADPAKVKAIKAAYYAANAEKVKAKSAAWAAANPDRLRETKAAYRAANIDKIKARNSAWSAANRDVGRAHKQNRRARKRANGGRLSAGLVGRLIKLQQGKCACCSQPLKVGFHLDHIMPLALGGTNTDDNMQLLNQRCNNQKHAKHPVDFMQQRGFLI